MQGPGLNAVAVEMYRIRRPAWIPASGYAVASGAQLKSIYIFRKRYRHFDSELGVGYIAFLFGGGLNRDGAQVGAGVTMKQNGAPQPRQSTAASTRRGRWQCRANLCVWSWLRLGCGKVEISELAMQF